MTERRLVRGNRGSTLVEELVAVAITGTAVVALLTGASAIYTTSSVNRYATTAGVVARDYAEAVESAVTSANWCSSSYSVSYTPPTGYSVSAPFGPCPSTSAGVPQLQTVTITVTAPSGLTETLTDVVREP